MNTVNYSELIEYNIRFNVEYKDDDTTINKVKVHEVGHMEAKLSPNYSVLASSNII